MISTPDRLASESRFASEMIKGVPSCWERSQLEIASLGFLSSTLVSNRGSDRAAYARRRASQCEKSKAEALDGLR